MEFWGLHLSSSSPTLLALKNVTAHVTKAVLVGKDATEADRVHVCYRDKSGHKFILCVLRNSIGHDQATLDVKLTNTTGCSMFLQVHNSAASRSNTDVKVVLTGYCTPSSSVPAIKDESKRAGTTPSAVSAPPASASVPPTPSATSNKRRRDSETEKSLEEFTSLRQALYGDKKAAESAQAAAGPAAEEEGEDEGEGGPQDTDGEGEGGFEGDEGDEGEEEAYRRLAELMGEGYEGDEGDEGEEGDEGDDLDEATLLALGFIPSAEKPVSGVTPSTSTAASAAATKPNKKAAAPAAATPATTPAATAAAQTKPAQPTPAAKKGNDKNNKNNTTPAATATPAASKLAPIKTPAAKSPAGSEDGDGRVSKRQAKKLRAEAKEQKKGMVTLPSGLQYEDTVVGRGEAASKGNRLQMRYKGTLATGQVFDSNMPRGRPFSFRLGAGEVIRGWDEGLQGMRVGGKRTLKIPSALGYGARGAGKIPPNANLTFEVELISKQ